MPASRWPIRCLPPALVAALVAFACDSPAATPPAPAAAPAVPAPRSAGKPAGAACTAGSECASGACEGPGCGTPDGSCVDVEGRVCGEAVTPFCGCDGKTFVSSTTCAGKRYRHADPCEPGPVPVPERTPGR